MTEEEQAIRELAHRLYYGKATYYDDQIKTPKSTGLRPLIVTPYDGAYGRAGWIIAVEGSPPRGTFVTATYRSVIYINSSAGKVRRLKDQDAETVFCYLKTLDPDADRNTA